MKLTATKPDLLLDWLLEVLKDRPRTEIKKWLTHGRVLVNGAVQTHHDTPLSPGDAVEVSAYRRLGKSLSGVRVLYEDTSLLVIDKPAGLLTIATEKEKTRTAYFEMNERLRPSRERVFIVHRLDRDTSGIVVFAKTEDAKRGLQQQWEKTKKVYHAVVHGAPKKSEDEISSHLSETRTLRVYSGPPTGSSKHAVTRYRVLRHGRKFSLLEVEPLTGRKNQIRVHLADIGHPVAGDEKYGAADGVQRLALHALKLDFIHPRSGKRVSFESPFPVELEKLVR